MMHSTTDCHCEGRRPFFARDGEGEENIHFLLVLVLVFMMGKMSKKV